MKRIFIYICIAALVSPTAISCTKGFESANRNPNEPEKFDIEYFFNSSVYYTVVSFNGEIKKRLFGNFAQYYWGESGQMGRYGNYPSSNNTYWRNCYNNAALPLRVIDETVGEDEEFRNRVVIARIWENYIFSQAVAIWGSIPYSNALKASQKVPYDREETIYYDILENLKECAAALDPHGDVFSSDPVFPSANGESDIAKWIKFTNSLRLRLALRISNDAPYGNPQKARSVIDELMEDEDMLISSNDENCTASWGNTTSTRNYFYDYMIVERQANKDKLATAGEAVLQHMAPYGDPRTEKFFTEANASEMPANFHWAPYWGQPKNSSTPPGISINPNPHSGKSSLDYSMVRDEFFAADYTETLLGYTEVCLLKCEAVYLGLSSGQKSAEQYYIEGIEASMERFGVDNASVADYLATPGIAWGTYSDLSEGEGKYRDWTGITSSAIKADDPDPVYRQIVMQQYIGLFYQSLEAWNLIRRTQVLEFVPHFNPDTGNGAVTPPGKTYSYMPQRLVYPDNEISNNAEEVAKAIAWLEEGDLMSTRLWFAKPTKTNPILEQQ